MSVQNNGLSDEIDVSESTIVVSLYSEGLFMVTGTSSMIQEVRLNQIKQINKFYYEKYFLSLC